MNQNDLSGRERFFLEQLHTESESGASRETAPGLEKMSPEEIKEHLSDLEKDDRRIIDRYPAELMAARINTKAEGRLEEKKNDHERDHERAEEGKNKASRIIPFVNKTRIIPMLAAAAFLIIAGVQFFGPPVEGEFPPGVERIKGMEPILRVYRAERGEAELLNEKAFAGEFDLLQLEYNSAGAPYGVIFSIDGRGTVTLHYPDRTGDSPQLESGSVLLPYSYQLDNAPEFERFFFVTSPQEFSPDSVLSAARDLAKQGPENVKTGKIDLPRRFDLTSFTILKEEI